MRRASSVDDFRDGLAPGQRETVDRLRALAAAAAPGLVERIKWNAPSFAKDDVDRITLGIQRNGDIRAVIHRGVWAKTSDDFSFSAPEGLVTWAAPGRGVLLFSSADQVAQREAEIGELFRRWMEID